jgi:hypothetical protein
MTLNALSGRLHSYRLKQLVKKSLSEAADDGILKHDHMKIRVTNLYKDTNMYNLFKFEGFSW